MKRRLSQWGILKRPSPGFKARPDRLGKVAQKTVCLGQAFPSKLEAAVFLLLKAEESAGLIQNLRRYPSVKLTEAKIGMKPDFAYERNGVLEHCEAKGFECESYKLKLRLWRAVGPSVLRIFKGTHRRPVEAEIVVPKCLKTGEL